MHHDHRRYEADHHDGYKILERVEGHSGLQYGIAREADAGEAHRVAVRHALRDQFHSDIAACARAVLDYQGCAQLLMYAVRDDPTEEIGDTAGGEWHYQLRRAAGKRVGQRCTA